MEIEKEIETLLEESRRISTSGFVIACHVHFTRPRILFQTYDPKWIAIYSEQGLMIADPTVIWAMENEGTKKWSDLTDHDESGVLKAAAEYGMKFGTSCAIDGDSTRTIGGFSREDREFEASEDATILTTMARIHALTADMPHLPPALKKTLISGGFLVHDSNG